MRLLCRFICLVSILFFTAIDHSAVAQVWSALGTGVGGQFGIAGRVDALAEHNGELYVGGKFVTAGGIVVNNIAKWDGSSWHALGTGLRGGASNTTPSVDSPCVWALASYNGELYATGNFTKAGGVPVNHVAKWNGTAWSDVGKGIWGGNGTRGSALAVYNGLLYLGGEFIKAGDSAASRLAMWNGTTWSDIYVIPTMSGPVASFCIQNNELYFGGNFQYVHMKTCNSIAKWNGVAPDSVGVGFNFPVQALAVYNGEIYAGGSFSLTGVDPVKYVAKWNGIKWVPVGSAVPVTNNTGVTSFAVFNNELYMGGVVSNMVGSGVQGIVRWNGVNWNAVGSGIYGHALALAVYNGALYVGGDFTSAGGIPVNSIAKWGPTTEISDVDTDNHISLFPNPNKGTVTITTAKAGVIAVTDVAGKSLGEYKLTKGANELRLPEGTAPGIYMGRYKSATDAEERNLKLIYQP